MIFSLLEHFFNPFLSAFEKSYEQAVPNFSAEMLIPEKC